MTPSQHNGIFTTKAMQPGVEIFTAKPYVFAIGGTTLADVKSICSHCLKSTLPRPVECEECNAVGYCSKECMEAASQLHKLECKGLLELEKLRGKKTLNPPPPIPINEINKANYHWPPTVAVITARALNRKVLEGENDWEIGYLARTNNATTVEDATFVKPYVVPLVHECVATDDMISDAFCRISSNYVGVVSGSPHVSALAVFSTYSLLNHSCQPNCSYGSINQTMSVYALTNIAKQEQLCISYISRDKMLLYGSARRKELQEVFRFECICSTCLSEAEPGSDKWVLDQKKQALIAPWKRETADHVMEVGLKTLNEVESSTSIADWFKVVETSTVALNNQRRYLSETNVIRILTSLSLMNAHDNLGNAHKALQLAEAMLPHVRLYDSAEGIGAHLARMSCYHFRIGNKRKGLNLFWESLDIFPRNLNNEHYLMEAVQEATNMAIQEPSITQRLASKLRDMDKQGLTLYLH